MPGTRGHRFASPDSSYGAVTLFRAAFQRTSPRRSRRVCGPTHHISAPSRMRIQFASVRRSIAFTNRIACCFLFLRVLRCFNSPRTCSQMGAIRTSQVQWLRAPRLSFSQLAMSFVSSQAKSSPVWLRPTQLFWRVTYV